MSQINLMKELEKGLTPKDLDHFRTTIQAMIEADPTRILSDNETVLVYVRSTLNANRKIVKKLQMMALFFQKFLERYEVPDIVWRIPCGPRLIEETVTIRYRDPSKQHLEEK